MHLYKCFIYSQEREEIKCAKKRVKNRTSSWRLHSQESKEFSDRCASVNTKLGK